MRGSEATPASSDIGWTSGFLAARGWLDCGGPLRRLWWIYGARPRGDMDGGTKLDLSQAADVENAYELMKQWRDANLARRPFRFRLNSRNLSRYREAADSLSAK